MKLCDEDWKTLAIWSEIEEPNGLGFEKGFDEAELKVRVFDLLKVCDEYWGALDIRVEDRAEEVVIVPEKGFDEPWLKV
jgi:hypothetical protein